MNLLVGYIEPDYGGISIDGDNITKNCLRTRYKIDLVPQSLTLYDDLSAEDNLEIFVWQFFHIEKALLKGRIKEKLESVQLYERHKDKVKTFSGTMKRRLNLV